MPTDRLLIGPMNSGFETALKPFLIAEDAFSLLKNAYVFRGRIRKRFGSRYVNADTGSQLHSRLRINVGTTNGAGNLGPAAAPGITFAIGQMFSIGSAIYTVYQANGDMLKSVATPTATFDTATGIYNFAGAPANTAVYFYPSQPVMGIKQYAIETALTDPTYVFDTQFAYQYIGGGYERLNGASVDPDGRWRGTDSQFFSTTTWRGALANQRYFFVVNNNPDDRIQYWNGLIWQSITPQINATPTFLFSAQIVVVYKNRLVFLNTKEGPNLASVTSFTNRARWSVFGDPTGVDAFREDIPGKGYAIDAATQEDIISAQFIKDTLVVFFESSTWVLAYTGNQVQPFTWIKLNTELGAEAFASTVPFDKVVLTIGNVGIHACNAVNVERIDDRIPDTIFDIHTGTSAIARIAGIRDYFVEQVYWTFPNRNASKFSSTYPNQVIVYNYKTGSWAINDDSITAFGYYFMDTSSSISWLSLTPWLSQTQWISGINQPQAQVILAGNQEGFMFIIDAGQTKNASVIQVTNLTTTATGQTQVTAINHNFNEDDYVIFSNLNGLANVNPTVAYEINTIDSPNTFTLEDFANPVEPNYPLLQAGDVYTGGGTIARASRIDMLTKQFNPYMKEGRNVYLSKVDFMVDSTEEGEISIDFLTSTATSDQSLTQSGIDLGMLLGNGVLTTIPYNAAEEQQDQLWHPVYFPAEGMTVQLRIYLSDEQMADIAIVQAAFQLHLMVLNTQRTTLRLQ